MSWMGLIAGVMLPVTVFLPFERFQARFFQPAVSWPLWMLLSPLRVSYDRHYDRTRVSVFMQNHVSMLDACVGCGSIPVPMCGLENAAHLRLPGYGWLLRMSNAIPVRRGEGRYTQISEAFAERRSRGISVLTFPEAHRTLDGKLRPFKSGVFRAAIAAGMPIVPVCVRGMFHLLPKGALTMRPSTVEVYVAPQIETEGLDERHVQPLMERVRQVQEAWLERGEQLGHLCRAPIEPARDDPGTD
ncbi:MAG: 1-acyl-sn-glycerol-3-phosphate acyltransferase [Myxococcales bacterium]|nr:1-acyl-sn-glycerol-3-phosphate acyltransferase [Myxococcales bacterium]